MGIWKKVTLKLGTKWGLPSLNGRHGLNFWRNSKISWRFFWALKFLKEVIPSLSYRQSKFGSKSWYLLLRFYTTLSPNPINKINTSLVWSCVCSLRLWRTITKTITGLSHPWGGRIENITMITTWLECDTQAEIYQHMSIALFIEKPESKVQAIGLGLSLKSYGPPPPHLWGSKACPNLQALMSSMSKKGPLPK